MQIFGSGLKRCPSICLDLEDFLESPGGDMEYVCRAFLGMDRYIVGLWHAVVAHLL